MKREIILLCLILQSSALAAEFAGGTGEPNDPYQIATAEDLISIGSDEALLDKHFVLVADIDLDPNLPGGKVFTDALIAQDLNEKVTGHRGIPFGGVLDGQGHTIANLHIEGEYGYDAGLFGKFSGLVKDLNLTDVVISGSPCGAIAGSNNGGIILRCRVTGQLSGVESVGGLIGSNTYGSLVECKAQVQVSGDEDVGGIAAVCFGGTMKRCEIQTEVTGLRGVGGFFGQGWNSQIIECQMTGTVIGVDGAGGLIGYSNDTVIWRSSANCDVTAERYAGGLVGLTHSLFSVDCYVQGSMAGSLAGGLVGMGFGIQVINCYAACEIIPLQSEDHDTLVGGLLGEIILPPVIFRKSLSIGCFWDEELSGITVSNGSDLPGLGIGLTTEQMQNESVFRDAGWDFSRAWTIQEGHYPQLQWEIEN